MPLTHRHGPRRHTGLRVPRPGAPYSYTPDADSGSDHSTSTAEKPAVTVCDTTTQGAGATWAQLDAEATTYVPGEARRRLNTGRCHSHLSRGKKVFADITLSVHQDELYTSPRETVEKFLNAYMPNLQKHYGCKD